MYRLTATGVLAAALAVLAAAPVLAQEATGTVLGSVTLEQYSIHGAVVIVVGTGKFTLTDELGRFQIDGVPAGSYDVLARSPSRPRERARVRW